MAYNNSRNRSNNNRNSHDDERNTSSINSTLEEFFTRNVNAFFYISIDTAFPNRVTLENHIIPIVIIRDIVYGAENEASNASANPFTGFLKDLINNLRRKEKIRKQLTENKPYRFTKNMAPCECPVCLNDFKPKQSLRKLGCDHEFHQKCIDRWLMKGNACCPICRKEPFEKKV